MHIKGVLWKKKERKVDFPQKKLERKKTVKIEVDIPLIQYKKINQIAKQENINFNEAYIRIFSLALNEEKEYETFDNRVSTLEECYTLLAEKVEAVRKEIIINTL